MGLRKDCIMHRKHIEKLCIIYKCSLEELKVLKSDDIAPRCLSQLNKMIIEEEKELKCKSKGVVV